MCFQQVCSTCVWCFPPVGIRLIHFSYFSHRQSFSSGGGRGSPQKMAAFHLRPGAPTPTQEPRRKEGQGPKGTEGEGEPGLPHGAQGDARTRPRLRLRFGRDRGLQVLRGHVHESAQELRPGPEEPDEERQHPQQQGQLAPLLPPHPLRDRVLHGRPDLLADHQAPVCCQLQLRRMRATREPAAQPRALKKKGKERERTWIVSSWI